MPMKARMRPHLHRRFKTPQLLSWPWARLILDREHPASANRTRPGLWWFINGLQPSLDHVSLCSCAEPEGQNRASRARPPLNPCGTDPDDFSPIRPAVSTQVRPRLAPHFPDRAARPCLSPTSHGEQHGISVRELGLLTHTASNKGTRPLDQLRVPQVSGPVVVHLSALDVGALPHRHKHAPPHQFVQSWLFGRHPHHPSKL